MKNFMSWEEAKKFNDYETFITESNHVVVLLDGLFEYCFTLKGGKIYCDKIAENYYTFFESDSEQVKLFHDEFVHLVIENSIYTPITTMILNGRMA